MEDVLSFLKETGLYQIYDKLKSINPLQANEILFILSVINKVFI